MTHTKRGIFFILCEIILCTPICHQRFFIKRLLKIKSRFLTFSYSWSQRLFTSMVETRNYQNNTNNYFHEQAYSLYLKCNLYNEIFKQIIQEDVPNEWKLLVYFNLTSTLPCDYYQQINDIYLKVDYSFYIANILFFILLLSSIVVITW